MKEAKNQIDKNQPAKIVLTKHRYGIVELEMDATVVDATLLTSLLVLKLSSMTGFKPEAVTKIILSALDDMQVEEKQVDADVSEFLDKLFRKR